MLEDIEQLAYKYHKPGPGIVVLVEDVDNDIEYTCYELSALKLAKIKQLELIAPYNYLVEREVTKTSISYCYETGGGCDHFELSIRKLNQN